MCRGKRSILYSAYIYSADKTDKTGKTDKTVTRPTNLVTKDSRVFGPKSAVLSNILKLSENTEFVTFVQNHGVF